MNEDQFKASLQETLQEMLGGNVHVQVVSSSEMDRLIASDNEGDSASCSDEDEHTPRIREREAMRQRALKSIRTAQAEALKKYEMLKALEKSIATPDAERTPKHTLDEILLSLQIRDL